MLPQSKFVHALPRLSLLVLAVMVLSACGSQPATTPPAAQATAPAAVVQQPTSTSVSAPTATKASAGASTQAPAAGAVSFAKDLAPMIENSCISCHGGEKTSRALDLKTYQSLMAGSQNGIVIVAGEAAKSKLVQAIQAGKMPKRGTKWTAEQLQLLVDWVNAGAQNN